MTLKDLPAGRSLVARLISIVPNVVCFDIRLLRLVDGAVFGAMKRILVNIMYRGIVPFVRLVVPYDTGCESVVSKNMSKTQYPHDSFDGGKRLRNVHSSTNGAVDKVSRAKTTLAT